MIGLRTFKGRVRRWKLRGKRAAFAVTALKLELSLLLLLTTTCAAIAWQDKLLNRTIRIDPDSVGQYTVHGYGDEAMKGTSTVTTDTARPLQWTCTLGGGYEYPFCGYEVLFDAAQQKNGLDLSQVKRIVLRFAYQGDADTLRFHLKNYDPRYSVAGRGETNKFNWIDFPVMDGSQSVTLLLSNFGVAEWWLTQNRIPNELSRPQFDNIVAADLQTGPKSKPGTHRFRIHGIAFEGTALTPAQFYGGILGVWLLLIGGFVAVRVSNFKDALREKERIQKLTLLEAEQAREAARRDHLTGLLNRSGVVERFEEMFADPRGCRSIAVIIVDVDNFKAVNDRYGHPYGDEVLASMAQILTRNVRADDIVGRWGGEEFIVICSNLNEAATTQIADTIRKRVEHFHFGDCKCVTASFGTYWCESGFSDLPPLVACADIALYAAKARGRNRAVQYEPSMRTAA